MHFFFLGQQRHRRRVEVAFAVVVVVVVVVVGVAKQCFQNTLPLNFTPENGRQTLKGERRYLYPFPSLCFFHQMMQVEKARERERE